MKELKNANQQDPQKLLEALKKLEELTQQPQYDLSNPQDVKVNIRADESVGPAMFKADPLIPGGYVANTLTIRAMRPDIFVLGESIEDLSMDYACACGKVFDIQFWKLCPYCGRGID